MNYIKQYNLIQYDEGFQLGVGLNGLSADELLDEARKLIGIKQYSKDHKKVIDDYNAVKPLPAGYKMTYDDSWCDAFISVIADRVGASYLTGRECGVQRHIVIFKSMSIWLGVQRPLVGDLITFDWDGFGFADHIGIVESIKGEQITTIEGNTQSVVDRRTYLWNNWRIKGYARRKYGSPDKGKVLKADEVIAKEVIKGLWGEGKQRVEQLKAKGYDPIKIQSLVNELMAKQPVQKKVKQVTVFKDATRWLTREPISTWMHGYTFEVRDTKTVQPHQSKEAHLLELDNITLGWLLGEDVVK